MKRTGLWYLRVSLSVVGALVCLLLIAFWVRSYYFSEKIQTRVILKSFKGVMTAEVYGGTTSLREPPAEVAIPYLLIVLTAATFTALPWVGWSRRFSLRAFLIVATVICVILGLVLSN